MRSPVRPRAAIGGDLKRDTIQQTALYMLVFRLFEGLATWLMLIEVLGTSAAAAWPIHLLFACYMIANALLYLQYREGRCTAPVLFSDLAVNLGTMMLAVQWTGGLNSPVVLICLIKIAGYGFVFSPKVGVLAVVTMVVGFIVLTVGEQLLDWPMDFNADREISYVFRGVVLSAIFAGAVWLFNQVAEKEKRFTREAKRATGALQREREARTVSTALLKMSEAVSHLTELDAVLKQVAEVAPGVLGMDYCFLLLWDAQAEVYECAGASGLESARAREFIGMRIAPADDPDLDWVRRLGHCAVLAERDGERRTKLEVPTLLTAPLFSGGRFYGVLQFARRGGVSTFTQNDLRIADGIASQTAAALERARLLEESHRLVRAVESTGEGVLITDRDRRIVFANQAFRDMFGYTQEEVLGRDSLAIGGGVSHEWVADVQRAVIEQNWRGEAMLHRKDGSPFPVALHVSLIRTDDNRVQGSVAIMEDISAQRELQEQMQRTERLAAAGELASGVAHEVNNALVGILGQVEQARAATETETLRDAMNRVETQAQRIAEIVQELLGFARPQTPERRSVDLRDLVRDTLTLMAHDLGRSRVRGETRFSADLPPVLADRKQIQQVLVNLFTNAMQAMRPDAAGVLMVTVQVSSPGMVCLEVQDNGVGIAPEALPRIFDPFFSTKAKGTGLGLSVSYAIVRAHGGDLTVRSTPQVGTTFMLRLPTVAVPELPAARTVLLVDDDPAVAETLQDMLTREGLAVRRAASGEEALRILAAESFDAIFLDVRLPDISGQEVYARLAAERPEVARRIVFVTGGLWRIESRGLRERLPAQPTLSKPCTAAQIREALRLIRDDRAVA